MDNLDFLEDLDTETPLDTKTRLSVKVIGCSVKQVGGGCRVDFLFSSADGDEMEQRWTLTSTKSRAFFRRKMKECFGFEMGSWTDLAKLRQATIGERVMVEVCENGDGYSVMLHSRGGSSE